MHSETKRMAVDARLVTLPKELQLVRTPDRVRSASDAKRLAHLAKKVDQFNTLHVGLSLSTLDQSAASLANVIATRQERALQQRSQLLKSRSNPRFSEQQEEAHARVEQKWQQHHEQTRAQKHALEKRLEAAQKRHEESRQEIVSHLSTRAASAGLQRRPSKSELAMTMETWLPQDSDRWMRDLRPGFGPINAPPSRPTTATTREATGAEAATNSAQLLGEIQTKTAHAFERHCQFYGTRAKTAGETLRQKQEGQRLKLHRILSEHYQEAEELRHQFEREDARDKQHKLQKQGLIEQWRRQGLQASLQRQELVVNGNVAIATKESWPPQNSDTWMAGLRASFYQVDPSILSGAKTQWAATAHDFVTL